MFKVNKKTLELLKQGRSGVFIVNFEHIRFLLLTLNMLLPAGIKII